MREQKSKFEVWVEDIENAVQISGQNPICIAFSILIGSPLLTANRLTMRTPNLTWEDFKIELSMHYSIILSDTHATQAFTHSEQGLDELPANYLHHASGLLAKIYHFSDMSRISGEGMNHSALVSCLNCRKLKDSMAGHRSAELKIMEECFGDIHHTGMEYE